MAGTHGALHHLGHGAEIKHAGIRLGIYLLGRGGEGHVDSGGAQQVAVGGRGARIGAQVVGVVKLRGVYKYAHYHEVALAAGALYQ